jgi:hypothetical protein
MFIMKIYNFFITIYLNLSNHKSTWIWFLIRSEHVIFVIFFLTRINLNFKFIITNIK